MRKEPLCIFFINSKIFARKQKGTFPEQNAKKIRFKKSSPSSGDMSFFVGGHTTCWYDWFSKHLPVEARFLFSPDWSISISHTPIYTARWQPRQDGPALRRWVQPHWRGGAPSGHGRGHPPGRPRKHCSRQQCCSSQRRHDQNLFEALQVRRLPDPGRWRCQMKKVLRTKSSLLWLSRIDSFWQPNIQKLMLRMNWNSMAFRTEKG